MFALTFPAEFRNVQAHYPIVFRKARGRRVPRRWRCSAFTKSRTCSSTDGWDAHYMPLMVERQPFLIGNRAQRARWCTSISTVRASAAPRAKPLFREHGGNSEFLERITRCCSAICTRASRPRRPSSLRCSSTTCWSRSCSTSQFHDGAQHRFAGFYTIQEERLGKLDAAALEQAARARLPAGDLHGRSRRSRISAT